MDFPLETIQLWADFNGNLHLRWMIRANTELPAGARKPHFHPPAHHTSEHQPWRVNCGEYKDVSSHKLFRVPDSDWLDAQTLSHQHYIRIFSIRFHEIFITVQCETLTNSRRCLASPR